MMKTRREFIETVGKGAMAGAVAFPVAALTKGNGNSNGPKRVRIGIIGAENSHTRAFGRLFNVERKFPGISVDYVWGETDEFALDASKRGSIPNIVKDQAEMLGRIDALIVDHRHAKYHLDAALPFVKAGIPTFIDKPFCYRVSEGKEFLRIAREYKTPVTSFSSVAFSDQTFDLRKQVESMGEINHIIAYGNADIESKYGGIFTRGSAPSYYFWRGCRFFYGVHVVQPLLTIFGEDVERVRVTRREKRVNASLWFKSGRFATLLFSQKNPRGFFVVTKDEAMPLTSKVKESDPTVYHQAIVEMFRTGKEPRRHESILKCVAVLEALEKSIRTQDWESVA